MSIHSGCAETRVVVLTHHLIGKVFGQALFIIRLRIRYLCLISNQHLCLLPRPVLCKIAFHDIIILGNRDRKCYFPGQRIKRSGSIDPQAADGHRLCLLRVIGIVILPEARCRGKHRRVRGIVGAGLFAQFHCHMAPLIQNSIIKLHRKGRIQNHSIGKLVLQNNTLSQRTVQICHGIRIQHNSILDCKVSLIFFTGLLDHIYRQ